jgi:ABC-type phosphate transport system substrate-binding protein
MASNRKYLALLAVAAAGVGGRAQAQTYTLNGSDTLEFVMKSTITKANGIPAAGVPAGALNYLGGGSGTGENNLTANKQSIAAMSRNLKSSVTATTPTLGKADPNSYLNVVGLDAAVIAMFGNAIKNVNIPVYGDTVDLTNKAVPNKWGVCSVTTSKRCAFGADFTPSNGMNAGCATNTEPCAICPSGETCQADTTSAVYTNQLQVILSGVDGSGSTLACAHPARLKAIADLGARESAQLFHFFRRDDNSGTTDTFKDKIGVKNFCNGRARGILSTQKYCARAGVAFPAEAWTNFRCSAQADCDTAFPPAASTTCSTVFTAPAATNVLGTFNVANQDLDPIRYACQSDGLYLGNDRAVTNCTNVVTGQRCVAAENPATCDPTLPYNGTNNGCPCTQGFVVALAIGDTYSANDAAGTEPYSDLLDVTKTISSRVAGGLGPLMGYAGREAVRVSTNNTAAPSIATFAFSDSSIRNDDYVMSRRLFLARASANTDAVANAPSETTAGGAAKKGYETALFSYMTDDGTTSYDGSPGTCHIADVVKKWGFLQCLADCTATPALPNICAKTYPGAPSFPNALVPGFDTSGDWWDYGPTYHVGTATGNVCASVNPIGANGGPGNPASITVGAGGLCPSGWNAAGTVSANTNGKGTAGPTGNVSRPNGYACSHNRECTSNHCADDGQAIGILICQP